VVLADGAGGLFVAPGHAGATFLLRPAMAPWCSSQGQVLLCVPGRNWTRNNQYTGL